jgi:hypothetical protein
MPEYHKNIKQSNEKSEAGPFYSAANHAGYTESF